MTMKKLRAAVLAMALLTPASRAFAASHHRHHKHHSRTAGTAIGPRPARWSTTAIR
jgi:hypothetical protein